MLNVYQSLGKWYGILINGIATLVIELYNNTINNNISTDKKVR